MNLNIIKSIQKTMRKDTGVDGDAQRLGQLVWMLFLKIFDDRETQWELLQNNYKSPLKIIEAQVGSILKETDIVRFQDIYGRIN